MKILLDNHHGIGDVAMFLSVLKTLNVLMPENNIDMLIKSPIEQELVELIGGVKNFYYYHPLKHSLKTMIKLIFELRKNKYDLGIVHIGTNPRLGALLMKLAGCKISIGSSNKHDIINYSISIDTSVEKFRAKKNALLLKGIGIKDVIQKDILKDIKFKGEITKKIKSKFGDKKIAGICIGTGDTVIHKKSINGKKWKDEYWIDLLEKYVLNGWAVIILGGPKEKKERSKKYDDVVSSFNSVMDLVGNVGLADSLEAISNCNVLVAADTGMAFCSALMGVPTISLLGPSDPLLACPYGEKVKCIYLNKECSPCYGTKRMLDCKERKCMNDISVDMVYEESLNIIN